MWPFRRHLPPLITSDVYRRWLRAERPPWAWFVALSEVDQEALALLGDEHLTDITLAVGWAVRDPAAAEAGVQAAAGDIRGEETLVQRLAAAMAEKIRGARAQPAAPAPISPSPVESSLGGLGERRIRARGPSEPHRTLFGRPASGAAVPEGAP